MRTQDDPSGQGLPVAKVNEDPRNSYRSSLKRGSDATTSWFHRRKLAKSETILPWKPYPPIKPNNAPATSMPALPHIKWQGINEQPEPTGGKCLICRRDLIFSPEGPVGRPPIPPPVAVLHCGHTFHDRCLQKITPEDQCKSPPCIRCAIGEN